MVYGRNVKQEWLDQHNKWLSINLEIRQRGPTYERLMRKASLELAMASSIGDYERCIETTLDAKEIDNKYTYEVYYLLAMAHWNIAKLLHDADVSMMLVTNKERVHKELNKAIEYLHFLMRYVPNDKECADLLVKCVLYQSDIYATISI